MSLAAYGPDYDPKTHSWSIGVKPQGPVCRVCMGRAEVAVDLARQPVHTTHSNPRWEPWEPDFQSCIACRGTGVRMPSDSQLSN